VNFGPAPVRPAFSSKAHSTTVYFVLFKRN